MLQILNCDAGTLDVEDVLFAGRSGAKYQHHWPDSDCEHVDSCCLPRARDLPTHGTSRGYSPGTHNIITFGHEHS